METRILPVEKYTLSRRDVSRGRLIKSTILTLAALLLFSCAGAPQRESSAPEPHSSAAEAMELPRQSAPAPMAESRQLATSFDMASGKGAGPVSNQVLPQEPPAPETDRRLRVYSADLGLLVNKREEALEAIQGLAEDSGGYVESSSLQMIVIRVPAEDFQSALTKIEQMGKVTRRSVHSSDVTAAYTDLERRLDLARRTRERLYNLLERSEDTEERVKILREIRRLSEEIETLSSQLENLAQQISFSRISVRLETPVSRNERPRQIPFPWIARLHPLEASTEAAAERLDLLLPQDFAVLEEGKKIIAESAGGTKLRIGAVPNEPRGDTRFWARALRYHLRDQYADAEEKDLGALQGVLFQSKDPAPFYYLVAVTVSDDQILVAEAFFPNRQELELRGEKLFELLGEAEL